MSVCPSLCLSVSPLSVRGQAAVEAERDLGSLLVSFPRRRPSLGHPEETGADPGLHLAPSWAPRAAPQRCLSARDWGSCAGDHQGAISPLHRNQRHPWGSERATHLGGMTTPTHQAPHQQHNASVCRHLSYFISKREKQIHVNQLETRLIYRGCDDTVKV